MKRINKNKFIEDLKKDFSNFEIQTRNKNNYMIIIEGNTYYESVVEFMPATQEHLYTVYINTNGNEFLNSYLVDYFKNLNLDKNYIVADRLNNIDYVC